MAVHPMPPVKQYNLPTGKELMSGPIVSGGMSRREKEIVYVIENIRNRMQSLQNDENFQLYKVVLFMGCAMSALVGVTLILFGLSATVIFEKYNTTNYAALVFGSLFCCPMFYWFYVLFLPDKSEKSKRKKIHRDRRDRRKPTLFNQLVAEAKKASEPPPRKIRVLAHWRKHDYPIIASNWKEFCESLENITGLAIERQLIRFKEDDLEIDFKKKLDEDYGLDNGDRLHIYNKGGFLENHSPIRQKYRESCIVTDDLSNLHKTIETDDDEKSERPKSRGTRPSSTGRPSTSGSSFGAFIATGGANGGGGSSVGGGGGRLSLNSMGDMSSTGGGGGGGGGGFCGRNSISRDSMMSDQQPSRSSFKQKNSFADNSTTTPSKNKVSWK